MVIALLTALWVGAASAQVPRQVGLGEVRVEDDRRIVALIIDEVEGVLAVEINIVLDSRAVTVLDFALNGDEIPVEFAPRWTLPGSTLVLDEGAQPGGYALDQNFPNPFNATTTIAFTLAETTHVELVIYNAAGQAVRTLVKGERAAGGYLAIWDGRDDGGEPVASGRYVARMAGAGFEREIGMTLLK